MLVAEILKLKGSRIETIGPEERARAAVARLVSAGIGALLVMDGETEPVGIFSERDLVRAVERYGPGALDRPVSSLMTRDPLVCRPEDSIDFVMEMMTNHRFRHLPVVDGGRLVGIVSIGDVVKGMIEEARHEADALRRYIVAR